MSFSRAGCWDVVAVFDNPLKRRGGLGGGLLELPMGGDEEGSASVSKLKVSLR